METMKTREKTYNAVLQIRIDKKLREELHSLYGGQLSGLIRGYLERLLKCSYQ
jgi:hypothetical protein